MMTLMFGATAAQAGIMVSDFTGEHDDTNPCEEKTATDLISNVVKGIATFAAGGIIVGDYTDSNETCGIIVGDRANAKGGIMVSD